MKRAGALWDKLISFENLHEAARRAALGKRKRPDVAAFLMEQETELVRLRRELESGAYRPGPYRQFPVREPKPRLISAAPFRDRVVHHALTQILEPVFERRFSKDSFACRKGFGTHRALERAKEAAGRFPYVLKCDVRKYFPSIDHEILKRLLARAVKCRRTLRLAAAIIDGSNPQEEVIRYFPGDDLLRHMSAGGACRWQPVVEVPKDRLLTRAARKNQSVTEPRPSGADFVADCWGIRRRGFSQTFI